MIFVGEDKDISIVIVNCDCGCDEELHIKRFKVDADTSPDYYLTLCGSKFYSKQIGIFRLIGHRLKNAWRILRGKEYLLCDINIKEEHIDKLIDALKEIRK